MIILSGTSRFRPDRLSSLRRWTDGSNPANGALPANGASISAFINKGYATVTTSQSTGANQATFATNQYNGKGCTVVTTSSNYAVSGLTYSSAWTKILVATPSTVANAYYEGSNNSTGRGPTHLSDFTPAGTTYNYEYYNNTDRLVSSQSATGLNIIATTIQDGGAINTYLNGTLANTKATASNTISGFQAASLFCATAALNQGAYNFCGLLDFNAILTAAELRSVIHYLGDYFGVTVA